MKQLKQLNVFLKLALAAMAIVVAAGVVNLLLIFQMYDLAGIEERETAVIRLESLETWTSVTSAIAYGGFVLFLILLIVGAVKMTKHKPGR